MQLQVLLGSVMLRRTKKQTLADKMPTKRDNIVFCQMSDFQIRAYRRLLNQPDVQLLVRRVIGSNPRNMLSSPLRL
eukprot:661981-Prorocentrum_minimum.AAC.1